MRHADWPPGAYGPTGPGRAAVRPVHGARTARPVAGPVRAGAQRGASAARRTWDREDRAARRHGRGGDGPWHADCQADWSGVGNAARLRGAAQVAAAVPRILG